MRQLGAGRLMGWRLESQVGRAGAGVAGGQLAL